MTGRALRVCRGRDTRGAFCLAALQVEKVPKPVASCAMPAGPNMKIKTETPMVKKAREGVMEFLLVRSFGGFA